MSCLVDARMLDTLSKKELEKMLGVTRKFHQASIVHGIHVLRLVKYDRQELAMRRHQAENVDSDPIVWTNQRFVKWVRTIDLGEYADNLKGEWLILRGCLAGNNILIVISPVQLQIAAFMVDSCWSPRSPATQWPPHWEYPRQRTLFDGIWQQSSTISFYQRGKK